MNFWHLLETSPDNPLDNPLTRMVNIGRLAYGGPRGVSSNQTDRLGPAADPAHSHYITHPTDKFAVVFRTATGAAKNFNDMSIFEVAAAARSALGANLVKRVITLRSGDCYVIAHSAQALTRWLNTSIMGGIPVTPSLPKDVSTCQGVIHNVHPRHYNEIRDCILKNPGSKAVLTEQLTNKYGRVTGAVKVTFASTSLPSEIRISDDIYYEVQEFVRPPLRCFVCQVFGHGARTCKRENRCASCAGPTTLRNVLPPLQVCQLWGAIGHGHIHAPAMGRPSGYLRL